MTKIINPRSDNILNNYGLMLEDRSSELVAVYNFVILHHGV
jgi:hypothetical protein